MYLFVNSYLQLIKIIYTHLIKPFWKCLPSFILSDCQLPQNKQLGPLHQTKSGNHIGFSWLLGTRSHKVPRQENRQHEAKLVHFVAKKKMTVLAAPLSWCKANFFYMILGAVFSILWLPRVAYWSTVAVLWFSKNNSCHMSCLTEGCYYFLPCITKL